LIEALQDKDPKVRRAAISKLDRIKATLPVEPLLVALHDTDSQVRFTAHRLLLTRVTDAQAVSPLLIALQDPDTNVRRGAVEALGQIGDIWAVDPLLTVLQDPDPNVRKGAVQALGQIGDMRAVAPLLIVLQDPDPNMRREAVGALGHIGGTRAVDPLLTALKDDPEIRGAVINALVTIGDTRAVEPLLVVLQNYNANPDQDKHGFGSRTVKALGSTGSSEAINAIIEFARIPPFFEHSTNGSVAIEALAESISRSATNMSAELLYSLANLDNIFDYGLADVEPDRDGFVPIMKKHVDCSHVRQLARQELLRRGEQL